MRKFTCYLNCPSPNYADCGEAEDLRKLIVLSSFQGNFGNEIIKE